jgi:DNA-directed RNA polymerase specialized sigma24 family protein
MSVPAPRKNAAQRRTLTPEEERMIFLLHQYRRMSAERVAQRMNVTLGQVRRILTRCVRRSC